MNDVSFKQLYISELQAMNWFENAFIKSLGELQAAAGSEEAASVFKKIRAQSQEQVNRLCLVFNGMNEAVESQESEALKGLIRDTRTTVQNFDKGNATRDAFLIMATQKAVSYQIAGYTSLISLARALGYQEAEKMLEATMGEQKVAAQELTSIFEACIQAD
jgi:ferritin-like metal-binding protein YciE